jgi:hypothetical protein
MPKRALTRRASSSLLPLHSVDLLDQRNIPLQKPPSTRLQSTALRAPSTMSGFEGVASPSDFDFLREFERIVDLDSEITNGTLDLGVTEQQLHGAQVAGSPVDDHRLGPPQ